MSKFARIIFGITLTATSLVAVAAPTRIHFSGNSHKITETGHLNRQHPDHTYVLRVSSSYRLSIDVEGHKGLVVMYHIIFPSGKTFGQKGYDPFKGRLTERGDYRIVVDVNQMATNVASGSYRLTLRR